MGEEASLRDNSTAAFHAHHRSVKGVGAAIFLGGQNALKVLDEGLRSRTKDTARWTRQDVLAEGLASAVMADHVYSLVERVGEGWQGVRLFIATGGAVRHGMDLTEVTGKA